MGKTRVTALYSGREQRQHPTKEGGVAVKMSSVLRKGKIGIHDGKGKQRQVNCPNDGLNTNQACIYRYKHNEKKENKKGQLPKPPSQKRKSKTWTEAHQRQSKIRQKKIATHQGEHRRTATKQSRGYQGVKKEEA